MGDVLLVLSNLQRQGQGQRQKDWRRSEITFVSSSRDGTTYDDQPSTLPTAKHFQIITAWPVAIVASCKGDAEGKPSPEYCRMSGGRKRKGWRD
jgi:hypothetical protein